MAQELAATSRFLPSPVPLRFLRAISDGVRELGGTEAIREAFTNFQRDLYTPGAG